jgi:hypothetical protein
VGKSRRRSNIMRVGKPTRSGQNLGSILCVTATRA